MNIKTLKKPNAPINKCQVVQQSQRFSCNDKDIFVADTYHVKVRAYPTNEITIRLNPHSKGSGDSDKDRLNKFDAIVLENGARKTTEKEQKEKKDRSKRPGWGTLPNAKIFSKRTQKKVERAVAALQAKFGKENTRFMTMTLPGSTVAAMRIMSEYSSYIINRINRFISNIIGKDASNRVSIWELQKRGALHNHTLIASKNTDGLNKIDEKFKMFCYRLFQELSNKTGIDLFERAKGGTWKDRPDVLKCNSEAIRVSASSYMSKYMSKDVSKECLTGVTSKTVFYPSVWASWGTGATKALHDRTMRFEDKRISGDDSRSLVLKCMELSERYSPEKYKQPLVYLDKVGYGVNIKIYVKPEFLDYYIGELEDYLGILSTKKNPAVSVRQVSLEAVEEMWSNELYAAMANMAIEAKYGTRDERLWRKQFRKNKADLPHFSTDEEWQKYYS